MSDLDTSIAQAYERGAAAAEAQRRIAEVRGTGSGEGGLVTAVVSGAGELVDLRIAPEALRLGPGRLGEAIVAAARYATDDARERGYTLLALALGDEAAAEVERADRPVPARDLAGDTAIERSAAVGVIGPGGVVDVAAEQDHAPTGTTSRRSTPRSSAPTADVPAPPPRLPAYTVVGGSQWRRTSSRSSSG